MKDFTILVNSEAATTNDAGIFVIALNHDVTHVKVGLQQTAYTVLYPTGGYVSVPRDLNDVPEIIIGSLQDNTYLNQYISIYKEIKSNNSATASELSALTKRLDSLQQILLQLNYTENDLRTAQEMQDGRDKYYPEITQNLEDFVSRAIDLKAALTYVAGFAFENSLAYQKLHEAVTNYNAIHNTVNMQRFNYERFIDRYWRNDSLTQHFHALMIFALDSVHQGEVLPFQKNINEINQYFANKKSDKELKEQLQKNISMELPGFEHSLEELENRNRTFQIEFKDAL
jgi:hypothetical protein